MPKWFLSVLLVVILAITPLWYSEIKRAASVDHRIKVLESRGTAQGLNDLRDRVSELEFTMSKQAEDRQHFIQVLERMDENLGRLSEAVVELKVELRNIKDKTDDLEKDKKEKET